jgi:hypothetical protein
MDLLNKSGSALQYLLDYKDGKIQHGLGIENGLDEYLKFKRKQINIILGHDNVGKTYWINWYFLTLALKHNLKFIIWSGENQHGQILRDLVQMYSGINFKNLTHDEIKVYSAYLEQFFTFVKNEKLHKPEDLLNIFEQSGCDVALIDPFTGLDRQMNYEGNYNFMNAARQFVNKTGMTIYINTHPNTESGRSSNVYNEGEFKGHLKAPMKDHVEGGKAFTNRCDDMIVIHRLIKHDIMKFVTWVSVEKVKDVDTGGKHTGLNDPVYCEYNYGLGFKVYGKDVISEFRPQSKTNLKPF